MVFEQTNFRACVDVCVCACVYVCVCGRHFLNHSMNLPIFIGQRLSKKKVCFRSHAIIGVKKQQSS